MNQKNKVLVTKKTTAKTPTNTATKTPTLSTKTPTLPTIPKFTSENQLQAQLWKIAWNEFPQSRRHIWAVPNGAKRTRYEQTVSKATGTLAGVWDLHCFYKGQFLAFELKVKGNKLSDEQVKWGELMQKSGAICVVITENDVDKFREAMNIVFGEDKPPLATASLNNPNAAIANFQTL